VIAIQALLLEAVHEHSRETLTVTVPEPPPAPKLGDEFVTAG
jgi:hypothetical protein